MILVVYSTVSTFSLCGGNYSQIHSIAEDKFIVENSLADVSRILSVQGCTEKGNVDAEDRQLSSVMAPKLFACQAHDLYWNGVVRVPALEDLI